MQIVEPKTVRSRKKPFVYYSVHVFACADKPAYMTLYYEYAGEAIVSAKHYAENNDYVYVREHMVWNRTKSGELSSSGAIYSIGK